MHLMTLLLLIIFYRRRSDGPFLLHACVFALLVAVAQVTPPLLEKRILLASVDRKKIDIYPPVDRIQNHLIRGYQERHLGAAAAGLFLLHTYVSRLFARLSPTQVALLSRSVSQCHAYVRAVSTLTGHCCK